MHIPLTSDFPIVFPLPSVESLYFTLGWGEISPFDILEMRKVIKILKIFNY